jgi:hypothetical protein
MSLIPEDWIGIVSDAFDSPNAVRAVIKDASASFEIAILMKPTIR